jgi:hypothetical protein
MQRRAPAPWKSSDQRASTCDGRVAIALQRFAHRSIIELGWYPAVDGKIFGRFFFLPVVIRVAGRELFRVLEKMEH